MNFQDERVSYQNMHYLTTYNGKNKVAEIFMINPGSDTRGMLTVMQHNENEELVKEGRIPKPNFKDIPSIQRKLTYIENFLVFDVPIFGKANVLQVSYKIGLPPDGMVVEALVNYGNNEEFVEYLIGKDRISRIEHLSRNRKMPSEKEKKEFLEDIAAKGYLEVLGHLNPNLVLLMNKTFGNYKPNSLSK